MKVKLLRERIRLYYSYFILKREFNDKKIKILEKFISNKAQDDDIIFSDFIGSLSDKHKDLFSNKELYKNKLAEQIFKEWKHIDLQKNNSKNRLLPMELWVKIFSYSNKHSLSKLRQVSSFFKQIVDKSNLIKTSPLSQLDYSQVNIKKFEKTNNQVFLTLPHYLILSAFWRLEDVSVERAYTGFGGATIEDEYTESVYNMSIIDASGTQTQSQFPIKEISEINKIKRLCSGIIAIIAGEHLYLYDPINNKMIVNHKNKKEIADVEETPNGKIIFCLEWNSQVYICKKELRSFLFFNENVLKIEKEFAIKCNIKNDVIEKYKADKKSICFTQNPNYFIYKATYFNSHKTYFSIVDMSSGNNLYESITPHFGFDFHDNKLIFVSEDNFLTLFNMDDQIIDKLIKLDDRFRYDDIKLTKCNKFLITALSLDMTNQPQRGTSVPYQSADKKKQLFVFNLNDASLILWSKIEGCKVSPANEIVIWNDKTITIWDENFNTCIKRIDIEDAVSDIEFFHDGSLLCISKDSFFAIKLSSFDTRNNANISLFS